MIASTGRAAAMPPFAQAYDAKCTLCHLQVPALNAYGRYVQRTGYAVLDRKKLERALPLWVGINPSYDSQDSTAPHRIEFGNVAVHAIGFLSADWTFHVQQWIRQNDQPGGLDTAWVAYNNLFNKSGHLFFGKIESPAPSPFSQWFDLSPFAPPQITVGEHTYQLDANRWGARLAYVRGSLDAEAGWLGSNADLSGAGDFSPNTDKTFQWKLAYAEPKRPFEAGVFGSIGSWPLTEGGTDHYHSLTAWVERDPVGAVPGVFAQYQSAFDANPGNRSPSAWSNAATVELYQTFLHDDAIFGIRKEFTNDGLGTVLQTGNVDLEYHLARFVNVYLETYLAQHQKPGYRFMLWWTTPLSHVAPLPSPSPSASPSHSASPSASPSHSASPSASPSHSASPSPSPSSSPSSYR